VNPSLGVIASAVLVFAVASLFVALLVAVLFPAARRSARGLSPANQAALLLALACAPALAGLLFLTLTFWPSLTHLLGLGIDHCHTHGHHTHLCLVHTPLWTGVGLERLLLVAAGLAVATTATSLAMRLWRVQGVVHALSAAQIPGRGAQPYQIVDSRVFLALTAGLIRPRVYLSSHLLRALSPAELTVIIRHEQAHQQRRDALRLLIADLLSRLHLPSLREPLLADLSLATERTCDERAALTSGDRLRVAEAILKAARFTGTHRTRWDALLLTATGSNVQARVEALMQPAPLPRARLRFLAASGAGLLTVLGGAYADQLHHAVESAMHILIG
jgi:hypothetical protein